MDFLSAADKCRQRVMAQIATKLLRTGMQHFLTLEQSRVAVIVISRPKAHGGLKFLLCPSALFRDGCHCASHVEVTIRIVGKNQTMIYSLSLVLGFLGAAFVAGFFGALLGVGGGIFIVPAL